MRALNRAAMLAVGGLLLAGAACRYEIDLRSEEVDGPIRQIGGGDGPAIELPPVLPAELELIADSPLGAQPARTWLFRFGDEIWVGPSGGGDLVARYDLDGLPLGVLPFQITGDDVAPHRSRNHSGSPYPSFGAPGCVEHTPSCGPDNEDGAVMMGSAVVGGEELIVAGGGRENGDQGHVYLGRVDGGVVRFSYLDLARTVDRGTLGLSSISTSGGRAVLGLKDRGRDGPRLIEVLRAQLASGASGIDATESAGCDPTAGDICDLQGSAMPGLDVRRFEAAAVDAVAVIPRFIEGVATLETYVAAADGVARCDGDLTPAARNPGAWSDATPASALFADVAGVTSAEPSAVRLRDRAIPGIAAAGSSLVLGRNTDAGPQLWRCGSPRCGPDSWAAVAPPDSDVERVTLVVSAPHLGLVGFDSPSGAHLYASADGASWSHLEDEALEGKQIMSSLVVTNGDHSHAWIASVDARGRLELWRFFVE